MSDWSRVREIVEEALELEGEERAALVEQRCAGDAALRREVEALLDEDTRPDAFLDAPVSPQDLRRELERAPDGGPDSPSGARLGPWRLGERLGAGGMGTVFAAARADGAFERDVAVKRIKPGLDSEAVLRRFAREQRVLARLDHPGIARLLDAGLDDAGRPYLVMERVAGRPLDVHCREARLDLAARVRLVEEVCDAVQAAHERLVVHRDLKPANVLVDGAGRPRLLDFGIAAVLSGDDPAGATRGPAPLLTPGYASPEQMRGEPVGTASDVFSLGVLLHELVTGALPFDLERLPVAEAAHRLEEGARRPPSRVVTEDVAREMGTTARTLAARLDGELDAVILRALRPEPGRRYGTAAGLAADLARWRTGFPVEARPDSAARRVAKLVRRHRVPSAALATAALALSAGFAATAVQRSRALDAAALARERFDDVRGLAREVLFELDPLLARAEGATAAREHVVATALAYLEKLSAAPEADAELLAELARGYLRVGDVLGGATTAHLGRREDAREAYGRALALAERLPPSASATAATLGSEGRARLAALDAHHGDLAAAAKGFARAIELAEGAEGEAVDLAPALDALARAHDGQVGAALAAGNLDDALDHAQEALALARSLAADAPADAADDLLSLARARRGTVLALLDRGEEAEADLRAALATAEGWLARVPEHGLARRAVAFTANSLARFLHARGRLAEARTALQRSLAIGRERVQHDPEDEQALHDLFAALHLAGVVASQEDAGGSALAALAEESFELAERLVALDPESRLYRHGLAAACVTVARARSGAGRHAEAVAAARRAVEVVEPLAEEGDDANARRSLAGGWWDLGEALRRRAEATADPSEAAALLSEARDAFLANVATLEALAADGALHPSDERYLAKGRRDAEAVSERLETLDAAASGP